MEWNDQHTELLLKDISVLGWALVRRFSSRYHPDEVLSAIVGLSREEFSHLRTLHYITCDRVRDFVERMTPSFLRSMPSLTALSTREDHGYPRGRIDWLRTLAARRQRGNDGTLYVTRSPDRSRNTQAARLFGYLLQDIVTASTALLRKPLPEVARSMTQRLRSEAASHVRTLRGRGVVIPTSARLSDFATLRRFGRADVDHALSVLHLRTALQGPQAEATLREIMNGALFAPEDLDALFEAWVLLQTVELHLKSGWSVDAARLIGLGGRTYPQFTLSRGAETVDVYYQVVPKLFLHNSVYKALFEAYDLDVSSRRPDIVLDVKAKQFSAPIIIEVKRSADRTYIADSVYKVLGYLSDFRASFTEAAPKAILAVFGGIEPPSVYPEGSELWIVPQTKFKALPLPY